MPILSKGLGQLPDNLSYYLFAHSTQRNSLMLYGGFDVYSQTIRNPNLYEYRLSTKVWSPLLQTQGTGPGDVRVGCMVQSKEQKEKRYIFFPNCFLCIFLKFHGSNPTPFFFLKYYIASDGSKMIIYGGMDAKNVEGGFFILDLQNLIWTQGAANPSGFRSGHACATNGDSFVVWGGKPSETSESRQHKKLENGLNIFFLKHSLLCFS